MKIIFLNVIVPAIIISIVSCNKLESINGMIQPLVAEDIPTQIGVIQDNLQTQIGNFSQNYHVEASLPIDNTYNLTVNGILIPQDLPNTFFLSSDNSNNILIKNKASFVGNASIPIALNGVNLSKSISLPFAKMITTDLTSWQISKTKGITLNFSSVNSNNTVSSSFNTPDGSTLTTIVAIAPSNLSTSSASSKYWVIDNNSTSFTIPPSELTNYSLNENIDIAIGSGVTTQEVLSGKTVNIFSANITHLHELTVY